MTAKIKLNAASGGGSFSIQAPSSSSNNRVFTLPDSADATLLTSTTSTGKILQVVSTTLTSASTGTMSTNGEITVMSRTYTPTVSSSNALIQVSLHLDINNAYGGMFLRLLRDSTVVSQGDSAGIRRQCTMVPDFSNTSFGGALQSFTILDTAISGTSEVTYKLNLFDQHSSGGDYYVNSGRDTNNIEYNLRSVSTLTVFEVGA